ncbi:MAG: acyl-CoA dehydrogenase family protein, partial [Pseudomonadota bacterium]
MTYPFFDFDRSEAAPFGEEKALFATSIDRFIETEIRPHHETWEAAGATPVDIWRKAGRAGLLCADVAEDYGGLGLGDY